MSEIGTLERLGDYIRTNLRNNVKKVSATFGSMIITIFGLILYGIKANLDWTTILMTMVFALQPRVTQNVTEIHRKSNKRQS